LTAPPPTRVYTLSLHDALPIYRVFTRQTSCRKRHRERRNFCHAKRPPRNSETCRRTDGGAKPPTARIHWRKVAHPDDIITRICETHPGSKIQRTFRYLLGGGTSSDAERRSFVDFRYEI